uniref:Uncharacterized protein n=1 Tax=Knipowitschia caucasica TaxID=637954 RepID=A0AAV2LQG6_KNICA
MCCCEEWEAVDVGGVGGWGGSALWCIEEAASAALASGDRPITVRESGATSVQCVRQGEGVRRGDGGKHGGRHVGGLYRGM